MPVPCDTGSTFRNYAEQVLCQDHVSGVGGISVAAALADSAAVKPCCGDSLADYNVADPV